MKTLLRLLVLLLCASGTYGQTTVTKLSDATLCPGKAQHGYAYTSQFSLSGYALYDCLVSGLWKGVLHAPDGTMVSPDVIRESGLTSVTTYSPAQFVLQYSREKEVIYFLQGAKLYELDPIAKTNRLLVDMTGKFPSNRLAQMSVGPGPRFLFFVQNASYVPTHIGTYDGTNFASMPVQAGAGIGTFDEAHITESGRVLVIYGNTRSESCDIGLTLCVPYDDGHGHPGFLRGSNGRAYKVSVRNDVRKADGSAGQSGCVVNGAWRPELGLYDDTTGKLVLRFGCDPAVLDVREHFSRSGAPDIFFASGGKYIVRWRLSYDAQGNPASAKQEVITNAVVSARGGSCYWGFPRVTSDHSGTRALWDANGGTCGRTDVWLAHTPLQVTPPPPAPPVPSPPPPGPTPTPVPGTLKITCPVQAKTSARCSIDVSKLPRGDVEIIVTIGTASGKTTVKLY